MTNEKLVDIQTVIDYLCSKTCAHYPEKNDECELCNKSWIDGLNYLPSTSYCESSEEINQAWYMLMDVHDMPDVPDKAKDIIGDVMLMLHQMIIRADESIITDFVAYQREQLRSHKIMELDSVDEAMTHIFLRKTGKAYIEYLDKLGQFEVKPGKKDEDRTRDDEGPKLFGKRTIIEPGEQFIGEDLLKEALDQNADSGKMIKLKKRTITERLIIAKSLIDSVIADSDQFRESTKMTEDVPDIHVGKTDFQPGDKFILELGAERRMFKEFEIAGTDLYVETYLLEKLTRYDPEVKLDSAQPEIIYCKDCKYAEGVLGAIWCDKDGGYYNPMRHFCSEAERRNDG